jgi:heme-degrading monooxygenase HmoA
MRKHAWAVVFTSRLRRDAEGYAAVAERIETLARAQPGYLGHESVRCGDGLGITVSYWDSQEAVRAWRDQPEHVAARQAGRERFYEWFRLEVCRIERSYAVDRR